MAFNFYSRNLASARIPSGFLKLSKEILLDVQVLTKNKWGEVSLVFVDPQKIKELNNRYHHKNKVTDVLSFIYSKKPPIVGEIIICPQQAANQAKFFQKTPKEELAFLFLHGCLHLQGFDHIKVSARRRMETAEDLIYKKLSL